MISFEYNRKKIILFWTFSIIMTFFFTYIFLNAESLSLEEPSSSSKYRYIGKLFYKNEILLKTVSLIIALLFAYFLYFLTKMLLKKKMTFKIINGLLFQDNKSIIRVQNIRLMELKEASKNNFIKVHLVNKNELIEKEKNIFRRIKYKISGLAETAPLTLNISYFKNKPLDTLEKLQKLVTK
jgi:hypothetical protein